MKEYARKLQKYNKLLSKYEEKVQKIAQKFTEELCKAIGAEQISYGSDKRYTHIIFEDIRYQSGSHDLDYYRGREPTLRTYLEEKVVLEKEK